MTFHFKMIPLCLILLLATKLPAVDKKVRPVRDPVGFCWQADETDRLVAFLESRMEEKVHSTKSGLLLAGIVPHDDFLYAGAVTWALLSEVKVPEVLIIGVTHGTVRKAVGDPREVLILESFSHWHGPYGLVPVSPLRERMKAGLGKESWIESDQAHALEHSVESLIPLLQNRRRDLTITPVMVTAMTGERMSELAKELAGVVRAYLAETGKKLGRDLLILISADGNHYGKDFDNLEFGVGRAAHRAAVEYDHQLLNGLTGGVLNRERIDSLSVRLWGSDDLGRGKVLWCGKYSIPFGLKLLLELGGEGLPSPRLLAYADTFSQGVLPFHHSDLGLTAPFSLEHWVSFFSVAVYAGK